MTGVSSTTDSRSDMASTFPALRAARSRMPVPHRAAALAVDAVGRLLGRRQVVRAARFTLRRARLDLPNDPAHNGEHALQRWVLAAAPPDSPVTVFDVGAHVGRWSAALLDLAGRTGQFDRLSLHAFEPASDTHRLLARHLGGAATVNRLAVSAAPGQLTLHIAGPAAGTNSVHSAGEPAHAATEVVDATSVDEYADRHGIRHIDLLKIDAEGHDFAVLRGAARCFQNQAIAVAQFEYNHRWVYARHFLKDVFDLLEPLGYRIGKLTPRGVERYPNWDPELETFIEGNYLAYTDATAARLPHIRWWNLPDRRRSGRFHLRRRS